jgi:hypothetical protein
MDDQQYYDDNHDHGPYNPLHPIREGFTMGVCATIVVGMIIWLLYMVV